MTTLTLDALEPSLAELRALERRHDGPLPAHLLETPAAQLRKRRGIVATLESQAARFIDSAIRCQSQVEQFTADLAEPALPAWRREQLERNVAALKDRRSSNIRCAADATREAERIRKELGLEPSVQIEVAALLVEAA